MRRTESLVVLLAIMLVGCQVAPRVSTWSAPPSVKRDQVYSAALRAVAQDGFIVQGQDREAGMITAVRKFSERKQIDMAVTIPSGNPAQVRTRVSGGGSRPGIYPQTTPDSYV